MIIIHFIFVVVIIVGLMCYMLEAGIVPAPGLYAFSISPISLMSVLWLTLIDTRADKHLSQLFHIPDQFFPSSAVLHIMTFHAVCLQDLSYFIFPMWQPVLVQTLLCTILVLLLRNWMVYSCICTLYTWSNHFPRLFLCLGKLYILIWAIPYFIPTNQALDVLKVI